MNIDDYTGFQPIPCSTVGSAFGSILSHEELSWKQLAMDMKELLQMYKQYIAELEAELEKFRRQKNE